MLLVEVKAAILDERSIGWMLDDIWVASRRLPARFGMVVDLDRVRIADLTGGDGARFLRDLGTADMLREYDPEFENNRIFSYYLTTLVEAWMSDHAVHWKNETPPGTDELTAIGLAQDLKGGDTRTEVLVGTNTLC